MEQNRVVTHFIVHSNYSQEMQNDIALVRVEPPLKLNRWIRPICLPEARPPWGPSPGTKCTAVGWGATKEHGPDRKIKYTMYNLDIISSHIYSISLNMSFH